MNPSTLPATDMLATLGTSWSRPAHGAQQAFRALLSAMAHPGRVWTLDGDALAGVQAPPTAVPGQPLQLATAVTLLTLVDAETAVHLAPPLASAELAAWLRFHTGAAWAPTSASADIVAGRGTDAEALATQGLNQGSDEDPQHGATLILEVDALDGHQALPGASLLTLRGPGVPGRQGLAVRGVPAAFWHWRRQRQADYPCGVDLLLCCGERVAAVPRSSLLSLED